MCPPPLPGRVPAGFRGNETPVFQACFTSNKVSRAALSDGNVMQATHVSLGFLTATFKKSTRKEVTLI